MVTIINAQSLAAWDQPKEWFRITPDRVTGLASMADYESGEISRPGIPLFLGTQWRPRLESDEEPLGLRLELPRASL